MDKHRFVRRAHASVMATALVGLLAVAAAAPVSGSAFPGANGKIAFTSERDGNDEIYVTDANGTNQHNLTNNPAPDFDPNWSPDGEQIAFTSFRDGNRDVYVMDADGSDQRRLTNNPANDGQPTWSPDGERIAFTSFRDGNNEIHVMDADGTHQHNLTNNPAIDVEPSWSPDGEQIAFTSLRDGNLEVYVMDADGSDQRRVTNNAAFDFLPNWQPREVDGDVTVTKWVNGTPPTGATYDVKIVCVDGGDVFAKTLTFGETGGTQSFEREGFGPLECTVTEPNTGGAATVEITCANGKNADCKQNGKFELFDDPGGDDTHIEINVTNTFAVTAEPTFTG